MILVHPKETWPASQVLVFDWGIGGNRNVSGNVGLAYQFGSNNRYRQQPKMDR